MNRIFIVVLVALLNISTAVAEVIVYEYKEKDGLSLNFDSKDAEPIVFEYKEAASLVPKYDTGLAEVIVFEYDDIDTKGLAQDVLVSSYHELSGKKVVLRQLSNGLLGLEIGGKQVLRMLPLCESCK